MRNYFLLFFYAFRAMYRKLKKNTHKRGFENVPLEYAYKRICEEVRELDCELHGSRTLNYKDTRDELADIGNFAAMGIFKCEQEIKKNGNKNNR